MVLYKMFKKGSKEVTESGFNCFLLNLPKNQPNNLQKFKAVHYREVCKGFQQKLEISN